MADGTLGGMLPARVLVLPVIEPTMMQRGAPAGLFFGDSFRSSSSRLTSRKCPRWLVLRSEASEEAVVSTGALVCSPCKLESMQVPGPSVMNAVIVQDCALVSSPHRQLKAVSGEGGLLGGGQVNGGVGHQGIQATAAAGGQQG